MKSPVGARLREAMTANDLTADELAQRLGVGVRLVQKWRAGEVIPSFPNLRALEEALDRPVSWFFSENGEEAA